MAFDAQNFIVPQTDWAGLYKAGDTLEKRRVRDQQIEQQNQARKHASAQYLKSYLDPNDFMTGTAYDPMIVKGLDEAMQQGMQLASQGVDTPTMMMALGPAVKRLSDYSTRAKALNTTIDDQIKKMQQSDINGYDYAALKREAMKSAMFDTDPKTGKSTLNPRKADAGTDWISMTIEENPELVTTDAAIDEYAKKSSMNKTLSDITQYNNKGEMDRNKVHLIGQNWLVPEVDQRGATTGMVPKYEVANDGGKPITHPFKGKDGKVTEAPVRVLDEEIFNGLPKPVIHRIMAKTKQQIGDYKIDGQSLSMDDPKAKLVARAIAYDDLNRRKTSSIEHVGVADKPSTQQQIFQNQNNAEYMKFLEDKAAAAARGRESVPTTLEQEKANKTNAAQAIGKVFKNDPEYLTAGRSNFSGTVKEYGTDKTSNLSKANVIDVTSVFPGGGLKSGRGEDHKFSKIMYDPDKRALIIEKETGTGFKKKSSNELVPENKVGQFVREIAEANGIPLGNVRKMLDEIGYKDQKFSGVATAPAAPQEPKASAPAPKAPDVKKLDEFSKSGGIGKLESYKGHKVGDDVIVSFGTIYNPLKTNNYDVTLKGPTGQTYKKEFKTKKQLTDFLESGGKPPATPAAKPTTGKGILD